jgi:hypothetical protein
MKLPEIKMVPIDRIDANPYRDLDSYPIIEAKVEALKVSFRTVGLWPSIVVRPKGSTRYEQAFGHQRMAAATDLEIKEVPVIVADLSNEQMVQYMGRENGEDYSADFLIMLNTWAAGSKFAREHGNDPKATDIARLLGWTRPQPQRGGIDMMNDIASACAGASVLISEGLITRKDLFGLTTRAARDIVGRAMSRMESIARSAKLSGAPDEDVEHAKKMVGKGVRATADEARKGTVPTSQIASRVDVNTLVAAGRDRTKISPLFEVFGRALTESIAKALERDANAKKLAGIIKVLDMLTSERDRVVLRQIDFQLNEVSNRAARWRKRLSSPGTSKGAPTLAIGGTR